MQAGLCCLHKAHGWEEGKAAAISLHTPRQRLLIEEIDSRK